MTYYLNHRNPLNSIHPYKILPALLFLFLLGFTVPSVARNYSTPAEARLKKFDQQQIDSLKTLKKYQYEIPAKKPVSLGQLILWKIKQWLSHIFDHSAGALALRYLILIVVIGIVVFQLLRANVSGVFGKKSRTVGQAINYHKINPVEINFDQEIQQSIEALQYREAIRLWYLKSLKLLHLNQLITWKENKTNTDFLAELKNSELSEQFRALCLIYDYIWYGEFIPDKPMFEQINNRFIQFAENLNPEPKYE